jgi:hypothetical protein
MGAGASSVSELAFWQAVIASVLIVVTKLVYCLVGFLTIKLGASLLREGVKGEFTFKTELHGTKADLVSASPGLFFALLGTFVLAYGLFVDKPVNAVFESTVGDDSAAGLAGDDISEPTYEMPGELE